MSVRTIARRDGSVIVFFEDGRIVRRTVFGSDVFVDVRDGAHVHRVGRVATEATSRAAADATRSADGVVRARTSGTVRGVVRVGDAVVMNDVLCTIELMKMTLEVRAPWGGVVTAVHVVVGGAVTRDAPLVAVG